jgi:hypothetical protein
MARPRVFISSTFYDLRQIRADLDSFIRRLGYDPIRNESGKITYGKEQKPEEYCYREIDSCDLVVAVIGGRFGSQSQQSVYSISQTEIRTAVNRDKSLFIFIEKGVFTEYQTFLKNKETVGIKYHYVDRPEMFTFIEEVLSLPRNNQVHPFETAEDITEILKEQWAGMFQRFLQQEDRVKEISLILRLDQTASTLDRLVQYLKETNESQSDALGQIVLSNHPAFRRLAKAMNVSFRVFFETREELDKLLESFQYEEEVFPGDPEYSVWTRENKTQNKIISLLIKDTLFAEGGRIQPQGSINWNDDWIKREVNEKVTTKPEISDDDIPF